MSALEIATIWQPGPKVVWKYPLQLTAEPQKIATPELSQPIHFAMQGDTPTVWLLTPNDAPLTLTRWFQIKGTGDPIGDTYADAQYVGTTQHGLFVWHLFQLLGQATR